MLRLRDSAASSPILKWQDRQTADPTKIITAILLRSVWLLSTLIHTTVTFRSCPVYSPPGPDKKWTGRKWIAIIQQKRAGFVRNFRYVNFEANKQERQHIMSEKNTRHKLVLLTFKVRHRKCKLSYTSAAFVVWLIFFRSCNLFKVDSNWYIIFFYKLNTKFRAGW